MSSPAQSSNASSGGAVSACLSLPLRTLRGPVRSTSSARSPRRSTARPEVALERRRDARPQQPRPRDRPRPEPLPQLVRRLDHLPPPRVLHLEQPELLARPERRRRHARAAGSACRASRAGRARRAARQIGSVMSDGSAQAALAGDRVEAAVPDLDRDRAGLEAGVPEPARDALGHREQRPLEDLEVGRVLVERLSWLTDFAASGSSTGSGSTPCARSTSDAPCLPNRRTSADRSSAARSPIVTTLKSRSAAAVDGADAPQARDRQRREELGLGRPARRRPGRRACAGRWRSSRRASSTRRRPTPSAPARARTASLISRAIAAPSPNSRARAGHVEERLVDRDRLDERREPPEDRHDLAARRLVRRAANRARRCSPGRAAARSGSASPSGRRTSAPRTTPR